jgi:uncharacterized membrane protein
MNVTHIHLLLNHFPTIGFGIAFGLFLLSLVRKSAELKQASLVIFFVIAVIAIPTYITGNYAQGALGESEGISEARVNEHESSALIAFAAMELTGFVAWLALWQSRIIKRIANWCIAPVLVLSVLTFVLMLNTANLGSEIRHPELMSAEANAAADTAAGSYLARTIGSAVTDYVWVWPACEALHFVGLCLLFAVVLIVDLRILGMAKSLSFQSLYQLLPFGMLGFVINLITGMMFFIASTSQYTKSPILLWKIIFVFLGGINVLYFSLFDEAWNIKPGGDAPVTAKLVAASAIFLWVGVLFFGHMLPFLGTAF